MVIISLAQGLGLDIVAEGVETKEQLEFLKKQGVSKIQGYYFSKPIASEKVDKFLDNIVK
jgi:EAL domain-containing protein (putative c-di-GMP-specific phosphodiesterase class I)